MKKYLSLVKFSHTIFAMPFAIIGFVLAQVKYEKPFDVKLFLLMIACMVFARSAAMAFNRLIDRKFDILNERTKTREIPNGDISPLKAVVFTLFNCIAFISCTYFINDICFYLSPVALLVILGYSLTKRFTAMCHLVLGIGLALAPIGAYLVISGEFALLPILFSFAVLTWVGGFDIIYALQDEHFDRSHNLHSIPVLLGTKNALRLSAILHIISAWLVVMAGYIGGLGKFYDAGAIIYIMMLIHQHSLVKPDDLSKVNIAFMTSNGIASVVFAVCFLLDVYV
jgi:4-hydroxybenzoate polyprenyltransferase